MNLKFTQPFDNIIVCGDIHGDIIPLVNKINSQYQIHNSLIIVAGDIGMGFHKDNYYLELFKKAGTTLKKNNNILLLVRGNHDNPDVWTDNLIFKKHWQDGEHNIRLVKDYTVISAESNRGPYNILCVGGAISVDRTNRILNKTYWLNEPFVYDESKVVDLIGITHVITHSCPNFCEPLTKGGIVNWMAMDENLEADCNKERDDHTLLYNKLKENNQIKCWHHGHFHFTAKTYIDDVLFRMCDIMELVEI